MFIIPCAVKFDVTKNIKNCKISQDLNKAESSNISFRTNVAKKKKIWRSELSWRSRASLFEFAASKVHVHRYDDLPESN